MLRRGLVIFFSAIALWLLIDNFFNRDFNNLKKIEITYYSENDPVDISLYFSSSELFKRELFLRGKSTLISENKYEVIFELKPFNINNLRVDTEFKKSDSNITFQKMKFISTEDTITIIGDDLLKFIEKANDVKYELLNSGIKITPIKSVENADYFITLSRIETISHYYFGGIRKKSFLILIFISLIIIIVFKSIKFSESHYWLLVTSIFYTTFYFNRSLLIISIIAFTIASILYVFKNRQKYQYSKDYFIISLIYMLYGISFVSSLDQSILKLLEYQFSLLLFPLLFYFLKLFNSDLQEMNLIFERVSVVIIFIIIASITLLLIESNLDLIDIYKNSPILKNSIFAWLDNPLHPSFLSYSVFIGLLFMINNKSIKNDGNSLLNIMLLITLYFSSMLLIGSRVSIILAIILIVFTIFKKFETNLSSIPKLFSLGLVAFLLLAFHLFLYYKILPVIDPVRHQLWELSLELIQKNPWAGIDYGQFVNHYRNHLKVDTNYTAHLFGHPHNQFLYFAVNFGIPFSIFFILIFGTALYKSLKSNNPLLFFFLIGSLIFMCFDLLLNSIKGVVPFAFFNSYIIFISMKNPNCPLPKSSKHLN